MPEGTEGVVVDQSQSAASGASASATGSPSSSGSPAASGPGSPTPVSKWEDDPRAKGMLADLQKERKARQEYERRVTESETRAAERDRQIAALTGAKIPSKEEADEAEVRARIEAMYPALGKLTPEQVDKLLAQAERNDTLEASVNLQWEKHAHQMLNGVYKGVADELGELSERQKKRLAAAYVAEAEANPEFLKRHDAGDPTLITEFVKNWIEDTVEPAKRKFTAAEASRYRAVPQGGGREVPSINGKPIDPKDDKAVSDMLGRGFVERGGQPGRRR